MQKLTERLPRVRTMPKGRISDSARRAAIRTARFRFEGYRDKADAMPDDEAKEYLLGIIEILCPALSGTHPVIAMNLGLTSMETRLVSALYDRMPEHMSREGLMDILYADRLEDPPEDQIVKVMVSHIRKKLAGSGVSIETMRCYGYRLNIQK